MKPIFYMIEQVQPSPSGLVLAGWAVASDGAGTELSVRMKNGRVLPIVCNRVPRPDVDAFFRNNNAPAGFTICVPNRRVPKARLVIAARGRKLSIRLLTATTGGNIGDWKALRNPLMRFAPYGLVCRRLLRSGDKIDEPLFHYSGFAKRLRRLVKFALPFALVEAVRKPYIPAQAPRELKVTGRDKPAVVVSTDPYPTLRAFAAGCRRAGGSVTEKSLDEAEFPSPVLVFSHELTRTGAPLTLLPLARTLRELGHQPVIGSYVDGPLRASFEDEGFPVAIVPRRSSPAVVARVQHLFDFIVACTVESVDVVSPLNGGTTPVLWWIHEAELSYHQYVLERLPEKLGANVEVVCAGGYAREVLLRHAPHYSAGILYPFVSVGGEENDAPAVGRKAGVRLRFACIGTFCPRKGQDTLVEALRLLSPEDRRRTETVFLGKPYDAAVTAAVEACARTFPDEVRISPEIGREEMARFYREIDVLVCPSRDDPMPLVVQEALKAGKAVICSESTGWFSVPELHGIIRWCRAGDAESLAQAIVSVLNASPDESMQSRTRGQQLCRQLFSEESFRREVADAVFRIGTNPSLTDCADTVSVVIPTKNAGAAFPDLLRKLRRQKRVREVEIVIVDSGSTDGTVAAAAEAGANVISIPPAEFSHSHARNLGVRAAKGEFAVVMTQDAMPHGNLWLARMLRPLLADGVDAVSCREIPREDCTLYGRVCIREHNRFMGFDGDRIAALPDPVDYVSLRRNAQLNDVASAARRKTLLAYPYRGDYAEDLDLGLRLIRDGRRLALLGKTGVVHSHERPAFYHFRRTIVEMLTLKRILPEMPTEALDETTVANRILTAYGVLAPFLADPALKVVVTRLTEAYRETWRVDDVLAKSVVDYVSNALKAMAAEVGSRPPADIRAETIACLECRFALMMGVQLAGYVIGHPGDGTFLSQLAAECGSGV